MVDMVVHRHQLRATIARLCRLLTGVETPAAGASAPLPVPATA
jgi:acetyl-CoA carboxylase carboxyl transferase subunit beta